MISTRFNLNIKVIAMDIKNELLEGSCDNSLIGMHLTYVGGFVALCCLTLLVSNRLPKPQTA